MPFIGVSDLYGLIGNELSVALQYWVERGPHVWGKAISESFLLYPVLLLWPEPRPFYMSISGNRYLHSFEIGVKLKVG